MKSIESSYGFKEVYNQGEKTHTAIHGLSIILRIMKKVKQLAKNLIT
ncbi:MAG: hypothetical protein IPI25_14285 [Candidatus Brocadia sp.]|nr:MAG: hypothetical protein IPI25_14285 [Candidatus Brocadia sp.]